MDIIFGKRKYFIFSSIAFGILIAILYYFDYNKRNPLLFWTLLFLFCFLVYKTISILTNKNLLFVTKKDLGDILDIKKSTETIDVDFDGIFVYTSEGFETNINNSKININWSEIETILGYKKDLITIDSICMDIITCSSTLTICEETPGWFKFLNQLRNNIEITPKYRDIEISTPAFKTNLTLLFDKKHRTLEQIVNDKV